MQRAAKSVGPTADALRSAAGDLADLVVDDPGARHDWTGRFTADAATSVVVRPRCVDDVVRIIDSARRHRVPVVAQGGNTGLVGASVGAGLIVAIARPHWPASIEVDPLLGMVDVDAAATLTDLDDAVRPHGWRLPVDLASRDRATIGGTISTNAAGALAFRFGAMRHHVDGLDVVTATGELASSRRPVVKANVGPRVLDLVIGAEGTLGIVTAARLRLARRPTSGVTLAVAAPSLADAVRLGQTLVAASPSIERIEWVSRDVADATIDTLGLDRLPQALRGGGSGAGGRGDDVVVIAELAGFGAVDALLAEVDDVCTAAGLDADRVTVAPSSDAAARWWRVRESAPDALAAVARADGKALRKFDISVPPMALPGVVEGCSRIVAEGGGRAWAFGHLADGNVHLNVTGIAEAGADEVASRIWELVGSAGGAPSAEHGIGREKIDAAVDYLGEGAVAMWRTVRAALDPDGIMNPGVLVGPATALDR